MDKNIVIIGRRKAAAKPGSFEPLIRYAPIIKTLNYDGT